MKKKIRNSIIKILAVGLGSILISACGSFDQISSSPMVKVKYREPGNSGQIDQNVKERHDSTEKKPGMIKAVFKVYIQHSALFIAGNLAIQKISGKRIQQPRLHEGISNEKNIRLKNISTAISSTLPKKQFSDRKTADSEGDIIYILIVIFFSIIGYLIFGPGGIWEPV